MRIIDYLSRKDSHKLCCRNRKTNESLFRYKAKAFEMVAMGLGKSEDRGL